MANPATSVQHETARKSFVAWAIATFFGTGFLRPGPGTWASAITAGLWFTAQRFTRSQEPWLATLIVAAFVTAIGIPACTRVAHESNQRDPGFAVIDEVAGQLIALVGVSAQWKYALASFILFRGFDIFKPPPIRQLEKVPAGWGIMLDDVAAGALALAVIQLWLHLAAR